MCPYLSFHSLSRQTISFISLLLYFSFFISFSNFKKRTGTLSVNVQFIPWLPCDKGAITSQIPSKNLDSNSRLQGNLDGIWDVIAPLSHGSQGMNCTFTLNVPVRFLKLEKEMKNGKYNSKKMKEIV